MEVCFLEQNLPTFCQYLNHFRRLQGLVRAVLEELVFCRCRPVANVYSFVSVFPKGFRKGQCVKQIRLEVWVDIEVYVSMTASI